MLAENNYLLVITPSEDVIWHVTQLKKIAKNMIGYFPSFNSIAHITINHYYNKKALLFDDRSPVYKNMIGRMDSFNINISGFDYFTHQNTYTIYAKVDLNPEVKTTFSRFKKVFGSDVPDVPHITIARSLTSDQFKILWAYLKNHKFEYSFYTEEIVVLKTPNRNFNYQPMTVETKFEMRKIM